MSIELYLCWIILIVVFSAWLWNWQRQARQCILAFQSNSGKEKGTLICKYNQLIPIGILLQLIINWITHKLQFIHKDFQTLIFTFQEVTDADLLALVSDEVSKKVGIKVAEKQTSSAWNFWIKFCSIRMLLFHFFFPAALLSVVWSWYYHLGSFGSISLLIYLVCLKWDINSNYDRGSYGGLYVLKSRKLVGMYFWCLRFVLISFKIDP